MHRKHSRIAKLLPSLKSQASLEYLTTYVWAFFAIALTVGALYSFGVFDFNKYLPQKCTFTSQFKCLDFSMTSSPTNDIRVKLLNNLGENVKFTSVLLTNDASPPISCTLPSTNFDWVHGTEQELVFTGCSQGGYLPRERIELKISFTYYAINTPTKPSHTVNGKINGRIS